MNFNTPNNPEEYNMTPENKGFAKSADYGEDSVFKGDEKILKTQRSTAKNEDSYVPARKRKKLRPRKSLFKEYVTHWYVFVLCIFMCVPAYLAEIFLGSLFMAKNITPFFSALLTMFAGGFIATFPLLILNIVLLFKKKYYAIAVQIIALQSLGLLFYLYNKMFSFMM